MKKKLPALFLAVVMCMSMSVPAFASGPSNADNGVMPCEDDYRCNHTPPSGYIYQDYTDGNTILDSALENGALVLSTVLVPELGPVNIVISTASTIQSIMNWVEEGRLRTTYHRYIYKKGSNYWYHTYWYYRDNDGYLHYLTCEVSS